MSPLAITKPGGVGWIIGHISRMVEVVLEVQVTTLSGGADL